MISYLCYIFNNNSILVSVALSVIISAIAKLEVAPGEEAFLTCNIFPTKSPDPSSNMEYLYTGPVFLINNNYNSLYNVNELIINMTPFMYIYSVTSEKLLYSYTCT